MDGHSDAISWFVNYAEKKEALKKEKQERQRLELDRKNKTQHNQDQNTDQMIFDDSAMFVRPYEHQDTNAATSLDCGSHGDQCCSDNCTGQQHLALKLWSCESKTTHGVPSHSHVIYFAH